MTVVNVKDRVALVLSDQIAVPCAAIKPRATLGADLNMDSFDRISFFMALEEEFHIEISDEEAERVRTVSDAIDLIESKSRREAA